MGVLSKIGITAFIVVNAKIFIRLIVSSLIIFFLNFLYSKYEALLLATNPDKLFIPLYVYTAVVIFLIIWTLLSFKRFSSFKNAEKKIQVLSSFKNKPNEYQKITDVSKYPKLKTNKDMILKGK